MLFKQHFHTLCLKQIIGDEKMVQSKNLDRRVIRTQKRLNEALLSLMSEKGFQSVTVQDITKRADVNRATFYTYYHDKHEMLDCVIMEVLQEFEDCITVHDIEQTSASSIFVRMFEHIGENANFYKIMLTKKGVPGFARLMLKTICDSFEQHRMKYQIDSKKLLVSEDILSIYTASSYLGLIMYWLENDMSYTPEEIATQLTNITRLGLPTVLGFSNQEVTK